MLRLVVREVEAGTYRHNVDRVFALDGIVASWATWRTTGSPRSS
ncbi:hypothetical protein ACIRJO_24440 [Streptomyces sp. NPDC102394]